MENKRTYRMYGMTPYNISAIQSGIQFGHAVQEFNNQIFEMMVEKLRGVTFTGPEYQLMAAFENWSKYDKTFIVLNGGTTNTNPERPGTLNIAMEELRNRGIFYADFYEPDLGDQLTAFVFLVDDRVFDRSTWPDYTGNYYADGKTPEATEYYEWKMKFAKTEEEADQIVFLREWLPKFRLA
jgi:hypothetical protein